MVEAIKDERKVAKRRVRDAYHDEKNREYIRFKLDALAELGLDGHPKADKLFERAWEEGHSFGYSEVWIHLVELADLIRD